MNREEDDARTRVALLWRGDPGAVEEPSPRNNRLYPLFEAFTGLNIAAVAVPYSDEAIEQVRERLLRCNAVLVWVDPITDGQDRSKLDPMLRDVANHGVWVSAHPDVIQKIGTKEVLFRTRDLGWGADTHMYSSAPEFNREFPSRLRSAQTRVLKQRRGNGGIGTWKVELGGPSAPWGDDPTIRVEEARRGGAEEEMALSEFMRQCAPYFSDGGCIIDQEFQPRVADGMVRCYLVHDKVAGFSTQAPRAEKSFAMAREKTMYDEAEPRFQPLRDSMESRWVPAMQRMFGIATESLPVIWDADFLLGPKTESGEDTYVLCEINISAVFPFPDSAVDKIARAVSARVGGKDFF